LHPQTRFSGAENEEKSRTAIYTISRDADVSACMLPVLPAKERLPDRILNNKFHRITLMREKGTRRTTFGEMIVSQPVIADLKHRACLIQMIVLAKGNHGNRNGSS
jgi:hypothetical protein